ncbi:MAG TPA: hypothetical protein VKU94_02940 [Geobacterales bacterium]|nr:hypothetical protein [Geobacterales bacterium]
MIRNDPLASLLYSSTISIKREVNKILENFENSIHRVVTIQDMYSRLDTLSIRQDRLLREAIDCIRFKLFRASIVLAWSAMSDLLIEIYFKRIDQSKTFDEVSNEFNDNRLIEQLRARRLIDKQTEKLLKGNLAIRDEFAHPSLYEPDLNQSLGYMSQILAIMSSLKGKALL